MPGGQLQGGGSENWDRDDMGGPGVALWRASLPSSGETLRMA